MPGATGTGLAGAEGRPGPEPSRTSPSKHRKFKDYEEIIMTKTWLLKDHLSKDKGLWFQNSINHLNKGCELGLKMAGRAFRRDGTRASPGTCGMEGVLGNPKRR